METRLAELEQQVEHLGKQLDKEAARRDSLERALSDAVARIRRLEVPPGPVETPETPLQRGVHGF